MAIAGHTGDIDTIRAGLIDDDPSIRAAALEAAVRCKALDSAGFAPFLDDPSPPVRLVAIELVPRLTAPLPLTRRLANFLSGSGEKGDTDHIGDADLAEVAAFALGELPLEGPARDEAVTALEAQALGHLDPLCREAAVAALGALGAGLDAILTATGDVATVRRRAVLALAPFDGDRVDAALNKALDDRDWQVRQAAEDLLGP